MSPFIWRGKSPFAIGICDENGIVVEEFVAQPGEEIPARWVKILQEGTKSAEGVLEVPYTENYDPKLVAEAVRGRSH